MTEFLGKLANFLSKQGKRITYDATGEVHPNPTITREGVLISGGGLGLIHAVS